MGRPGSSPRPASASRPSATSTARSIVRRPRPARPEAYVDETGTVVGFDGAEPIDAEELLELDVDLLVPAALEGVLHAGNAQRVRARLIVEGANGPTTPEADEILADSGVTSCPTSWPTPAE